MLHVSHHAVERFIKRWRPGLSVAEARRCLEGLAAHAVATRRRTLLRDALVYTSMTEEGERVPLAVRDDVVVTVLEPSHVEAVSFGSVDPDDDLYAESEATRRECQAMLKAERHAAKAARPNRKAVERARETLAQTQLPPPAADGASREQSLPPEESRGSPCCTSPITPWSGS